jgi:hypothetical protein
MIICIERIIVINNALGLKVLEQSFHALSEVSPRYLLRCTMDIAFCGEEGIDSGGLTREWSIPTHTYIHTYIHTYVHTYI